MIKKIKDKFKQRKIKKAKLREYMHSLPSAYDNKAITWNAPEHVVHKRGKLWKVIVVGLLIAAMVTTLAHQAWTFALAIVSFAFVYYLLNREHPKEVEVSLSNIGIQVGRRKYPYARVKSFWVVYEPPYTKTLYVKMDGELMVNMPIQLADQDPSEVREFLIDKVPENENQPEPLTDIFSKLFKI